MPTTTRRPHVPSVQTNSTSEGVSASQLISWDAAGGGVQSAAILNLSVGCRGCIPDPLGHVPGLRKPPVIWIITLLLLLGASAAVGLWIDALTPDKPAEPPLAQRWKAMGGG